MTHIIVGAGQAGGWAAVAMRQAGYTGRIVLIGDEPWRPYERPPLSKAVLTDEPEPPIAYFHTRGALRGAGDRTAAGHRRSRELDARRTHPAVRWAARSTTTGCC